MSDEPELIATPDLGPDDDWPVVVAPTTRHRRRHRYKPEVRVAALNITSFLDMSFALLTFLILGASFAMSEGVLSAKLPQGAGGAAADLPQTPQMPLIVNVSSGGGEAFRIDFEGMGGLAPTDDFKVLAETLRSLRHDPQNNPGGTLKNDNPVVIQPRGEVTWQGVMQAFNAAQRARYTNVAIAKATE